jgi:hypothetical protein
VTPRMRWCNVELTLLRSWSGGVGTTSARLNFIYAQPWRVHPIRLQPRHSRMTISKAQSANRAVVAAGPRQLKSP